MNEKHYVYLIPGFFGFADLGGITYFHHVRQIIERRFRAAKIDVEIYEIKTLPTASIARRTGRLLEKVAQTALGEGPIHLIGHSTGGLDARLFVSPGASVDLSGPYTLDAFADRVDTIVTVATPHHGTPMANFFSSILGEKILYLISLTTIYTMEFGKVPMTIMLALGEIFTELDDHLGLEDSVLDGLYEKLFSDFDEERQEKIKAFLGEIKKDQTLVTQLTPEGIADFNAMCKMREDTRYGSVAMKARKPGLKSITEIGLNPYRQTSHLLYRFLHWLCDDDDARYPECSDEEIALFERVYGNYPDRTQSDGVVPTRSQVWGTLFHVGKGDHLDVCGHFDDQERDPPHYDWIATGTSFSFPQFEELWNAVCSFVLQEG